MARWRASSHRYGAAVILTVAAVLFAAVFVSRLVVSHPGAAVLVLLCLPVSLLAVAFGRWAGLAGAAGADAVVVAWDGTGGDVGGLVGYAALTIAFGIIGFVLGWYAERVGADQRLRAVLETMLDAVVVGRAVREPTGHIGDFRVEYANPTAHAIYGRGPEELIGRTVTEVWRGDPHPDLFQSLVRLVESGEPVERWDYAVTLPTEDGPAQRVLDLRAARFGDGYVSVWRDVTERHRDALNLAATSAQFEGAFDHAPVGMALVGRDGVVVRANPALGRIVGYRPDELIGTRLDAIIDQRDVENNHVQLTPLLRGDKPAYRSEVRLIARDATVRWASLSASLARSTGGDFIVAHLEDIHERKSYEGRLQYLADHDPLTSLYNRRRFHEELAHQMAIDARSLRSSALILVDLDNFKYINDTLGHQVGDQLIQLISRALRARLRDGDVVGRLGGDEFAVLLPGLDEAEAVTVARALLAVVGNSQVVHAGHRVRSTGSAGVVGINGVSAGGPDDILANADLAMYAAKEAGRNTCVLHDPAGQHVEQSRARFQWLDRIRHALDHDLLTLQAQPIVDVATGVVAGCELLLRMRVDGELIAPDEFLPIAERHGLANAIDRWVVPRAIAFASEHRTPSSFKWEVNLSADSLGDDEILKLVVEELSRTSLPPSSLVFEITETAAIANIDQARAFASAITDIGCEFALDDFGAGYGSFYYLKHLPFEYLKIDGEFIRHLVTSDTDRIIVEAIVGAARQLGKRTIAEYVGDQETLEQLRKIGVDFAQGHLIGPPASSVTGYQCAAEPSQ